MSERDEAGWLDAKAAAWRDVTTPERRLRLARETERALREPARRALRPVVWAPALGFAALALAVLWSYRVTDVSVSRARPAFIARSKPEQHAPASKIEPRIAGEPQPAPKPLELPLEVVENSEFYEDLPLMEDWDAVQKARREKAL